MHERMSLYTPPFSNISSYLEMVDIAVEYGFKNIETINSFELGVPDLEFARKLRHYADEKGITFTCVSAGINLVDEDGRDMIEQAKGYADVAAILGSPYLHHTIALEFQNPEKIIANRELYYNRGIAAVQEICDYAHTLGIRVLYEEQGYLFNGIDGYSSLMADANRDVGTVADFGNIMFVDERVEDFIPLFTDRIVNVHIKDYIATCKGSRDKQPEEFLSLHGNYLRDCAFGEGSVDFAKAFEQLKNMNYQGYFALECSPLGEDQKSTFEKNIEMLEQYIKKMGGE